jgi:hypothetical protein
MGKRRVPEGTTPAPSTAPATVGDVAMVLDRTEDAQGYRVLRRRGGDEPQIELGTMRPLQEGRPIDGEVISLERREDMPFLYNVKTELPDPHAAARAERRLTSDGPPQIATEEYRQGWDAIWGSRGDKLN